MGKRGVIICIDPGQQGGISILEGRKIPKVFPIPLQTTEIIRNKKKTKKHSYDIESLANIFREYSGKEVLFVQEKVSVRPQDGGVSAFGFGKSAGQTLGMAVAFNFNIIEVNPRTWKKHFPELETKEIISLREQLKQLKEESKSIKDKKIKKENKKRCEKVGRAIKSSAKDAARELAGRKYPRLKDKFILKNSDGLAESLLIGIYAKENYGELVQKTQDK